jgi:hypothetical protein
VKTIHLKNKLFAMVICLFAALSASVVMAQTADELAITSTIKKQWEQPDKPLQVMPVVVANQYAIAGWVQGERGGRALLRRNDHGWDVFMCGGDDLTKPQVLIQSGVDAASADVLAQQLKQAEQGVSMNTRKQFSTFEGVMPVDAHQSHAH